MTTTTLRPVGAPVRRRRAAAPRLGADRRPVGTVQGLRRYFDQQNGMADAAAKVLQAGYGGGSGEAGGGGSHPRAAALPNLRYGHKPPSHDDLQGPVRGPNYRDTPERHGRGGGGEAVGAGPGTDGHTRYRAKGGKGLTEEGRNRVNSWMSFFMRSDADGGLGLDRDKAMAMVGMMQGESGQNLDPKLLGDVDPRTGRPTSGGTAQWHNERWASLKAFAAARNKPWTDMEVQQQFWKHEVQTVPRLQSAFRSILAAPDGRTALDRGVRRFEVPKHPDAEIAKRMPNYDRLKRGDFDRAPEATASEQAAPPARSLLLPRPAAPTVAPAPIAPDAHRIQAMSGGVDFDTSGIERAIAHVDTLHGKLRALKATASVDITHHHKGDGGGQSGYRDGFRSFAPAPAGRITV